MFRKVLRFRDVRDLMCSATLFHSEMRTRVSGTSFIQRCIRLHLFRKRKGNGKDDADVRKQIEAILCAVPKQWSSSLPKRRARIRLRSMGKHIELVLLSTVSRSIKLLLRESGLPHPVALLSLLERY